ncbi:hypothetical protein EN851_27125 [Mesorhizobium sp. M8A.F.Ca.ET.208.01.1.1]|uniref:hypothetical protein n=1 Tax=unclassified Mesorhizobium TaxID=325217 RepID=UPI001093961D|nr:MULTISPECIES: hypothetical protein [unclassified Mesorhizobium]TGQ87695.1 hypothetical protein EN851_27125 [Mesorhizobium sp. M8A.F.Ca.ET.208.01.1.1]TGT49425.1 hypothetical protein EN810_27025 [Mesorhizobium sp. M8A.F.Ca.ET.167.01.1.1]
MNTLATATVGLVLADLDEAERMALAGVDAGSLLAFAKALSPMHKQRAALVVRDGAILQLAALGLSAADIEREMDRYAGNGWRRDRILDVCPPRYAGRPQAWLWMAMNAHPHPLSRRRIAEVLEKVETVWRPAPPSDRQRSRA